MLVVLLVLFRSLLLQLGDVIMGIVDLSPISFDLLHGHEPVSKTTPSLSQISHQEMP